MNGDSLPDISTMNNRKSVGASVGCVVVLAVALTSTAAGCRESPPASEAKKPAGPTGSGRTVDHAPPTHGFLGLTFDSVDATPLVIKDPVPNSPAAGSGIREGDLLVGVNDLHNPSLRHITSIRC